MAPKGLRLVAGENNDCNLGSSKEEPGIMESKSELDKTLGLRIHERKPAKRESTLADTHATREWAQRLPLVNVGETSRQVFKRLTESNQTAMPPSQRIEIVEHMVAPIDYIATNLKRHYFDVSFPLPDKQRKIAHLVRELYAGLATAYKTVIADMAATGISRADKKLLATAIQRAIKYLLLEFYQATLVYEPIGAGLWSDVHQLYALAEERGIENTPIKNGDLEGRKSRVTDLYKEILLFSITSPFNHRQEEIERIHEHLHAWSALAQIETPNPAQSRNGLFVDRLSLDEGPLHIDLQTKDLSGRCRVLRVQGVLDWIQRELGTMRAEDTRRLQPGRREMSRQTLEQLLDAMSSAVKRRYTRTRLNFELQTILGLGNLHALLSQAPDSLDAPGGAGNQHDMASDWLSGRVDSETLYAMSDQKLGSGSGARRSKRPGMSTGISRTAVRSDGAPSWAAPRVIGSDIETLGCSTINESTGGYCLQWPGAYRHLIRIGELVGVQSPSDPRQFGAGVIRWIKNESEEGLQIGLQTVGRSATAVLVQPAEAAEEPGKTKTAAGVILQGLHAAEDPPTLIVPPYSFGSGDTVWIASEHGEHLAKLVELIEQTGAFSRFRFEYVEVESEEDEFDFEAAREFDGIWSMI